MQQKIKPFSIIFLALFLCTSFLSLSESLHHSLDSPNTPLHFHSSTDKTEHHSNAASNHSSEEDQTMVSLDQNIIKNTSHSLSLALVVFETQHTNQQRIQPKEYVGKLSGNDPPISRLDFASFYPNAPPSLA